MFSLRIEDFRFYIKALEYFVTLKYTEDDVHICI